ncbi:predicted protein [Uncinocarpus reesii 1704]|uniref:DUF2306 domain-containing protein n=1 Tax=Uncinocarpus reesii (strain UAMH 1704) TaxID=336963 RepID=C4JZN1_UNCRE|nr:uncharacterized protein UREG_07632 [Uncinocarpus reesii 1704]EEP82767.1 predicted protein [Uncinocarpus reesii 1704]
MASIVKHYFLKASQVVGYSKLYNFSLWFIFAGALLGFALARLQYLHAGTYAKGAVPGEWYYAHAGRDRVGIFLHLGTILPCAILVVFQFVPRIRQRCVIFHRTNGYIVIFLLLASNAGALMIMDHAFGGGMDVQTWVVTLVVACTLSVGMAWWNIRRLQIEQHRAWMLRTMFYMGCIITTRLILVILAVAVTRSSSPRYGVWPCGKIRFTYQQQHVSDDVDALLKQRYPDCAFTTAANLSSTFTPISASLFAEDPARNGVAFNLSFGAAAWVAFFLHLVGVEVYLRLTPREAERLRMVSYERQFAAGYKNPGSAGLVVERWGDAKAWGGQGRLPLEDSPFAR